MFFPKSRIELLYYNFEDILNKLVVFQKKWNKLGHYVYESRQHLLQINLKTEDG